MPDLYPRSRSGRAGRLIATAEGSQTGSFGLLDWALLVGVALIWGSSYLFIDIALESLAPPVIAWARSLLGFLALAVLPMARRRIDRADLGRMVLLGLTWVAIPFVLFPLAQRSIDSALAGMFNALVPIWSAVIAALLIRTLPRLRLVVGVALGFIGALLIGYPVASGSEAEAWGVVLVVVATLLYGFSLNTAVPLTQRYGSPALLMWALGIAAALLAPVGLMSIPQSSLRVSSAISVLVLGVLNTGGGYVLMAALVGRVGSTRGSVSIYLLPLVATLLGVTFRNETVVLLQLAGMGLVLMGAWLSSRRNET
ncbi:MAG: DMT family transporter [Acidimicrobiia bacterium]|nr:DMT family transporter [Acidimicrobiia bacterium]